MSNQNQTDAIAAKVLKLCNGDKEMVLRLFTKKRSQFPGKSQVWLLSMVLWDLERGLQAIQPVPTQYAPIARDDWHTECIEIKLLKLCDGDQEMMQRLVADARKQNPHMNEQWAWELAVWLLERKPASGPQRQDGANIAHYDNPLESPDPTDYAPITPNSQQYQQPSQTVIPNPYPKQPKQPAPVAIPNSLPSKYRNQSPPARSTHYSSAIETKLIRLCQGDRKVVKRLIEHTRNMHPGRDEQWIYEKACWDLERDRH
jgi:hypothetical protein